MNSFDFLFDNGDLRKIKLAGKEIIQRIYYAVRDETWLNIPYTLFNYDSKSVDGNMMLFYELLFEKEEIKFKVFVNTTITDNSIVIETSGKSLSNFKKNRIGLCVHIPSSLKGIPCGILHSDNNKTISNFPIHVSPNQPFKNISEISWVLEDKKIQISFEGDVFEMEDQRNWTDASYKIYSTPLELPFPVEVKKGDTFYQKIIIKSINIENTILNDKKKITTNYFLPCPNFGILDLNNLNACDSNVQYLFSHIRIDFRLYKPLWNESVAAIVKKAIDLQIPIYCMVYVSTKFKVEINNFLYFIEDNQLKNKIHSVALLSSEKFILPDSILREITFTLRISMPTVRVGGGTDANFAQLNRNRIHNDSLDFVFYSIQPQEHASDKLSITENIMGQFDTVATAKSFSPGKDIDISALSLYRRFNANVDFVVKNDDLKNYYHKGTNFETGWYIGSIYQLIVAGVKSITFACSLEKSSPLLKFFNYMATFRPEYFYAEGSLSPEEYSLLSWKSNGIKYSVFGNLTENVLTVSHFSMRLKLKPYEIRYIRNEI